MPERHPFEITYRGERYAGEWRVEDGLVHVTSAYGATSGPAVGMGRAMSTPSERAQRLLWELIRSNDPKRSFFYWR